MRKVASYSFSKQVSDKMIQGELSKLNGIVKNWLNEKGKLDSTSNALILTDGRNAEYSENIVNSSSGIIKDYKLTEPTDTGLFQTRVFNILCQLRLTGPNADPAFPQNG